MNANIIETKNKDSFISLNGDFARFLMTRMMQSTRKQNLRKNIGIKMMNQFHLINWSILVETKERKIIRKEDIKMADKIGLILMIIGFAFVFVVVVALKDTCCFY